MKVKIAILVVFGIAALLLSGCGNESVTGPTEELEVTMTFVPGSAPCEWDPTENMWLWKFGIRLDNPNPFEVDFNSIRMVWDERECPGCRDSYEVTYDCDFIEFLFGSCSLEAGATASCPEFGFWSGNPYSRRFRMFLYGPVNEGEDPIAEARFMAEACGNSIGTSSVDECAIRILGWD